MTSKPPLLGVTMRWFLLAMILANVASEMVFSLLAVYLASLNATVAQIGMIYSVAALVPLALQILGGWLSDSIGRLRTIAIGGAAATFGYLGMWLAPTWQWVLVALCLEYISSAMVGPSFSAFIAEQSPEEQRGRVFGITKGLFLVVSVIGPALGGFLAYRYGFKPMLMAAFVLYALAAVLRIWMATTVRFAGASRPERPTLGKLRMQMGSMVAMLAAGGVLTWILLTDGIRDVAFRLSMELEPLYLAQVGGMNTQQIGQLRSLLGLAMIVATLAAGWLSDRLHERPVITAGFLLQGLGLVIFIRSTSLAGFALAVAVYGAGVGLMMPPYDSLISKVVPEKMRGVAFGLFGTSLGLISLPAPWIGARLWEQFGPAVPFAISAGAALLAMGPAWFKFVLPEKAAEDDGSTRV